MIRLNKLKQARKSCQRLINITIILIQIVVSMTIITVNIY